MQIEKSSETLVSLSSKKRGLFIVAVQMIIMGFMASNFCAGVALPVLLEQMGSMEYYAACSTLPATGMMLSLPLVGKFSELFGKRNLALFGMGLQMVTRIFAGFSANPISFLCWFTISSIGAGLYMSLPNVFLSDVLTTRERSRHFGFLATSSSVGSLLGPLLSGLLIGRGFASIGFNAYIPIIVVSAILVFICYPNRVVSTPHEKKALDVCGIFLIVGGVGSISIFLSFGDKLFGFFSPVGLALLFVGILSICVLIWYEGKHQNPSVPIHMFRKRRFTVSFLCVALTSSYSSCAGGFCILFAQQIMQVSAEASATVTMPQTIVQSIAGLLIGRILGKRFAKRFRPVALISLFLVTSATVLFFLLSADSSILMIYIATALGGFALSVNQVAFTLFFQSELRAEEYGAAQSMYSFGGTGGACVFAGMAGVLMNAGFTLNYVFLLGVIFCVVAIGVGFVGFRFPKEGELSV